MPYGKVSAKMKQEMSQRFNRNLVNTVKGLFEIGMGVDALSFMEVGKSKPKLGHNHKGKNTQKEFNRMRDR
jgi:hypothetical protein